MISLNTEFEQPRVWLAVASILLSCMVSESKAQTGSKPIYVHYMAWYESKPVSGHWGWHWTMNHFKPDRQLADGRREIASHDYPLIGPYDSNDPDALECQVLLMKIAGIEGVIVDWYGREKFRDYAMIHRNTGHLLQFIKRAGLRIALCFEDQAVKHLIEADRLKKEQQVAHGRELFAWLGKNWFSDDAYLRVDSRPLMLVFGPQHYLKSNWDLLTESSIQKPMLLGLPHLSKANGFDGAFGWPPVVGGREISPAEWGKYLDLLYARSPGETIVGSAFPGFRDIYQEAGLHASYGSIRERDGKTLEETLSRAQESSSPLIQIATWNDYGEGTVIEPTRRSGYRYLEMVQRHTGHSEKQRHLELPVKLYELRKSKIQDSGLARKLDTVSAHLFAGRYSIASRLLDQF
jgi:hypothetical protein